LDYIIIQPDRLFDLAIAQHVKDRREGLLEDHALLRIHFDDSRTDIITACNRIDPLGLSVHGPVHRLERALVDQWPDQRAGFARIADRDPGEQLLEARHQPIGDGFMDDQSAKRSAALSRRARGGEQDRPLGQFQVG